MRIRPDEYIVGITLMTLLLMVGLIPSAVTAQTTDYNPQQVAPPFQEIWRGVYLYWTWWNQSSDDLDREVDYTGNSTIPVEDIYGNWYYIKEEYRSHYEFEWEYNNLLVTVLLDPDASYVAWLSSLSAPLDIWMIYWSPNSMALTGDEVFVYSAFYYSHSYGYLEFKANFTWYDEFGNPVEPSTIFPTLKEEYYWTAYYIVDYDYTQEWNSRWFGYDVNEMVVQNDQTYWMNHYFSGISAFNDSNANGVMDIYYDLVEYDWDQDGIVDWSYYEVNETASEKVYDFYSETAQLGRVNEPFVNADGQIEWSAEVTNINGYFTDGYPVYFFVDEVCRGDVGAMSIVSAPTYIPANLERLEMVYRFEVTDSAAVLKIDQHIGDFTDPLTGEIHPAASGLGMTLNYWSSFSSYDIVPFTPINTTTFTTDDSTTGIVPVEQSSDFVALPQGSLLFRDEDTSLVSVEFGGTYIWGRDSGIYSVGTMILPQYGIYTLTAEGAPMMSESSGAPDFLWQSQYYYYSSCYAHWDGHSVTHDPVFVAYPAIAPGSVNYRIDTILASSIVIGAVGLVSLTVVCTRIDKTRR